MKLGSNDIIKMYLGNNLLTSNNMFLGEVPVIDASQGPEPVPTLDYFYLQPLQAGNYTVSLSDTVWKKNDTFEFSTDAQHWRQFSDLDTSEGSVPLADYMVSNPNNCVLALDIQMYQMYVVNDGYTVTCYEPYTHTGEMLRGKEATLLGTDSNFAYYECQLDGTSDFGIDVTWMLSDDGFPMEQGDDIRIEVNEPFMVEWNMEDNTKQADPSDYNFSVSSIVIVETINLHANDKLYLRNTSGLDIIEGTSIATILMSSIQDSSYNVGGILNTIYDYSAQSFDTVGGFYAYYLFSATPVINASLLKLPATTLARCCYANMFYNCDNLTSAPALPATTLATECYYGMFYGCSSLTTAPELPATTLAGNCYYGMFWLCTSLTTAPALPATELTSLCYFRMFSGCSNLTTAPELPATTLARYCYGLMFYGCSSLTTAPELPATTLVDSCYSSMFENCSNLNYVKCLATNISASYSHNNWLNNVASTGTFVKAASMSGWPSGASGIPTGWTVENV